MTTATRPRSSAGTSNPLRPKALSYFRDGRVLIGKTQWGADPARPAVVRARIAPNPKAPGLSKEGVVERSEDTNWAWVCTRHPGQAACSCRLVVQMVTGWEYLGGGSA